MSEIKGYRVRGTTRDGLAIPMSDTPLGDLAAAQRAVGFHEARGSTVRIFAVAEDGAETMLPTYEEALTIVDLAKRLAIALAPWKYEGSIEGPGAHDVVEADRALCVAIFGEPGPPLTEEERAAWQERRRERQARTAGCGR